MPVPKVLINGPPYSYSERAQFDTVNREDVSKFKDEGLVFYVLPNKNLT
jgi:hypothetical protein